MVYIIKYALSRGVYEAEVIEDYGNMVKVKDENGLNGYQLFHGENSEWCRIKEKAIDCAEEMRNKKIKSLEKQIVKMKSLNLTLIEKL